MNQIKCHPKFISNCQRKAGAKSLQLFFALDSKCAQVKYLVVYLYSCWRRKKKEKNIKRQNHPRHNSKISLLPLVFFLSVFNFFLLFLPVWLRHSKNIHHLKSLLLIEKFAINSTPLWHFSICSLAELFNTMKHFYFIIFLLLFCVFSLLCQQWKGSERLSRSFFSSFLVARLRGNKCIIYVEGVCHSESKSTRMNIHKAFVDLKPALSEQKGGMELLCHSQIAKTNLLLSHAESRCGGWRK